MSDSEREEASPQFAVVLDYLPHGRADDDRPSYQKPPIAYAVGEADFTLFDVTFDPEVDPDVGIGDRIVVEPPGERDGIQHLRSIEYDDLSGGAKSELEYVVEEIVEGNEGRFVGFYNDAQPITLRLHQLNLLPGIGKKLRNNILDQRKRKPFEDFGDLEERVSGLHDPVGVLVERIMEELREDDLKYKAFVRGENEGH